MSEAKQKYKTVHIYASMSESYEIKRTRKKVGTEKAFKLKGFLNPTKIEIDKPIYEFVEEAIPTGASSETEINSDQLTIDVENTCNELAEQGYRVINITPILRGAHRHRLVGTSKRGGGYGFGYSVTSGMMITAELI